MNKNIHNLYYLLLFPVITIFLWNTGLYTDDYLLLEFYSNKHWYTDYWSPNYLSIFPWWVIKSPIYILSDDMFYLFDIAKILIVYFSIISLGLALSVFINEWGARILAFLIILYPTHDATVYWYNGQYFNYGIMLISFAFYLQTKSKYVISFFVNLFGAFFSYASPPIGFGYTMVYAYKRKWKEALFFGLPHLFYFLFYIYIKQIYSLADSKINLLSLPGFLKSFFLQLATMFDTQIGISFILKIYYSILSINTIIIIPFLFMVFFFFKYKEKLKSIDIFSREIMVLMTCITVSALAMFALTGDFYYQMNFNLGNRVTIYASFLFAYVLTCFFWKKKYFMVYAIIMVLSISGISTHYKEWNKSQVNMIHDMSVHQELQKIDVDSHLFVKGPFFSKFGPFSHIEFITWDTLKAFLGKNYPNSFEHVIPLHRYLEVHDEGINDTKYNFSVSLNEYVYIYDISTRVLKKINRAELSQYINDSPKELRHWVQMLPDTLINNYLLKLVPRIKYLFA